MCVYTAERLAQGDEDAAQQLVVKWIDCLSGALHIEWMCKRRRRRALGGCFLICKSTSVPTDLNTQRNSTIPVDVCDGS